MRNLVYVLAYIIVNFSLIAHTLDVESDEAFKFDRAGLAELSRVSNVNKFLPLDTKCGNFESILRHILPNSATRHMSRKDLFEQTVMILNQRKLPFNNRQPFLESLKECLTRNYSSKIVSPSQREVIAGPQTKVVKSEDPKPFVKINEEFNNVKNNVKDFGQDIYHPKSKLSPSQKDDNGRDSMSNSFGPERNGVSTELSELNDRTRVGAKYSDTAEMHLRSSPDIRSRVREVEQRLNEEMQKSEKYYTMWQQSVAREAQLDAQLTECRKQSSPMSNFRDQDYHIPSDYDNTADDELELYSLDLDHRIDPAVPLVDRCQKFYQMLVYPDAVTSMVVDTIATAPSPANNAERGFDMGDYMHTMNDFVATLQMSRNDQVQLLAKRLYNCSSMTPSVRNQVESSYKMSGGASRRNSDARIPQSFAYSSTN